MARAVRGFQGFPDGSAYAGAEGLVRRWAGLLEKAPHLGPWLQEMIVSQRRLLQESSAGDAAVIELQLWSHLERWLAGFEALPQFAVTAIATTLHDEEDEPRPQRKAGRRANDAAANREIEVEADDPHAAGEAASPERSTSDREALLADPAFALAFHCVEVRLHPAVAAIVEARPALQGVPASVWFGLLHASAKVEPKLNAETAVALVLRLLSPRWAALPTSVRTAALRLFHASAADVRQVLKDDRSLAPPAGLQRLIEALPAAWSLPVASLPDLVAASAQLRAAFSDAASLCARLVTSVATAAARDRPGVRLGGLSLLIDPNVPPAAPAELAELERTARSHPELGFFASSAKGPRQASR